MEDELEFDISEEDCARMVYETVKPSPILKKLMAKKLSESGIGKVSLEEADIGIDAVITLL